MKTKRRKDRHKVGRQYKVYENDVLKRVYEHFNRRAANAGWQFDVDSDLGVGPFYCDVGHVKGAMEELRQYLEDVWGRDCTRVKVTKYYEV